MFKESLINLEIAKEKQKNVNIWENSFFDGIQNLSIDQSGYVGEKSFFDMVSNCLNLVFDYSPSNTDQPDGIYEGSISFRGDEKIEMKITNPKFKITSKKSLFRFRNRVETKTARLGSTGSWQHEKIKDSTNTDYIVFIDYAPNSIFLTILKTSEMDFTCTKKHHVFGRKIHHRKKEDSYKFDISLSGVEKGIKAGITLEINDKTENKIITDFIEKFFIKNPLN